MHVVRHSTDGYGRASQLAGNAAEICVKRALQFWPDRWSTVLRAEDHVHVQAAEGLRHTCVALSGLLFSIGWRFQGLAPLANFFGPSGASIQQFSITGLRAASLC